MDKQFKVIRGGVTAPKGFFAAGVFCDIKRLGTGKGSNKGRKLDLGIIRSAGCAVAAGMFTTNQICAAPVKVCIEHLKNKRGTAYAIVVNSGNANACTGAQGLRDAKKMAQVVARELGFPAHHVLVASTGRIGVPLPMRNVANGILEAQMQLGQTLNHGDQIVEAMMTSDTRPKQIAVELLLGGKRVRIGGVCKGAGMIQPGMSANGARPAAVPLHATMLCFLTSDAAIERAMLQRCLGEAVANSFNRITVDGDMSTNDTVLILANGDAKNPQLTSRRRDDLARFQTALNFVTLELAKMIVRDGEGVSRFVTLRVSGARSFAEADAAARAVGNSALVKTSWCGGDPNWGRIIDALGYSPAKIVEEKVDIAYSLPRSKKLLYSLKRGQPTSTPFGELCKIAAQREFDLHINLNLGKGSALLYSSDLTEAYVDFNKGDVSDPSSLGG
jgi:glutamate N-acetyltransferase / amino-acid N-acetyltransferase